jgi:hypothetical protein
MSMPKLEKDEKLNERLFAIEDHDGKIWVADAVLVVKEWLVRLSQVAEEDGAMIAPEVIDGIVRGINEGRF